MLWEETIPILTYVHISSIPKGAKAILNGDLDGADVYSFGPVVGGVSYFLLSIQILTYIAT